MRRLLLRQGLLAVISLLIFGCDSDGPEFADGEVLVIEGTLDERSSRLHGFALTSSGTVNIELTRIAAIDRVTGQPGEPPLLSVAIGRPAGEICQRTLTRTLAQGNSFSVFLESRDYCLVAIGSSAVLATAIIEYTLTLDGAFS